MKGVYLGLILFGFSVSAFSQTANFRSRVTGNWSTASTWERDVDGDDHGMILPGQISTLVRSDSRTSLSDHGGVKGLRPVPLG